MPSFHFDPYERIRELMSYIRECKEELYEEQLTESRLEYVKELINDARNEIKAIMEEYKINPRDL